jgi:hypothetical protein
MMSRWPLEVSGDRTTEGENERFNEIKEMLHDKWLKTETLAYICQQISCLRVSQICKAAIIREICHEKQSSC